MKGLSIKLSENGGAAPEAVPYMPAGVSEICATVNGVPGRRVVVADRVAAERLNADLAEKLQAAAEQRKARPLVMFDHNVQGGAAAVPVGFEWDEERGILLRVEWTKAGREAVEGGVYGYVSPSFRLRPGSCEILGLADGVEVGSLVNDPAFERNECIAAAHEVVEDVQVHAANPYGCNQYGHEFKAPHGEGWKPRGQSRDSGKEEGKQSAQENDDTKKITEDYENAEKAYREAENKVWEIEDEIAEAYNKDDYEKADKLERKQSRLAAEAKKLKAKAKEAKEKWRKATNSDYDEQDLVDLKNEQRDKRAEASENRRKIERLTIDLIEAEKTAAASRSAKDKKQTEKIRAEWNNAKKKQEELYERLRVIHKIFNPSWELKASYAELDEDLAAAREVVEDVQVHAANPYGCNQYGHEFKAPHGEGWRGGGQQEDTLDSIKKRKFDISVKQQETADELVKLAKQSEAEKDLEKRKKINEKIAEVGQKQQKLMEQYRKLAMKETELKDRERQNLAKQEKDSLKYYYKKKGEHARAARFLPPREIAYEEVCGGYNEGTPGGVGLEGNTKRKRNMEEIAKLLGLPADADAATICAKIAALKNQGAVDKKRIEEVEAEKEEHKKALREHKHAAADAFVKRQTKEGKIAPLDKERLQAARNMYLSDPEGAECIFAGMRRVDNVREEGGEADKVNAAANRNYENLSLAELLAEEENV